MHINELDKKIDEIRNSQDIYAGQKSFQDNPEYLSAKYERIKWQDKVDDARKFEAKINAGEIDYSLVALQIKSLGDNPQGILGATGIREERIQGKFIPVVIQKINKITSKMSTQAEQDREWRSLGLYNNIEGQVRYIQELAGELFKAQENPTTQIPNEQLLPATAELISLLTKYQNMRMSPFVKRDLNNLLVKLQTLQPLPTVSDVMPGILPMLTSYGQTQPTEPTMPTAQPQPEPIPVEAAPTLTQKEPSIMPITSEQILRPVVQRPLPDIVQKVREISPTKNGGNQQHAAWIKINNIRYDFVKRAKYVNGLVSELINGQKNPRTKIDDTALLQDTVNDLLILLRAYSTNKDVIADPALIKRGIIQRYISQLEALLQ